MSTLPMVIPSDIFIGMPMQWIPHAKYINMMEAKPDDIVDQAKRFFITAHNDTLHFYDGKPYSYHLARVVKVFHKYKHLLPEVVWPYVEASLWGHDSIEDARLTYNNVKQVLNEMIAEGAFAMSNEKGKTRGERANNKYYAELRALKFLETLVGEFMKLCDRHANVGNSVETGHNMAEGYSKEMKKFEERLRGGDDFKEMWDDLYAMIENANATA